MRGTVGRLGRQLVILRKERLRQHRAPGGTPTGAHNRPASEEETDDDGRITAGSGLSDDEHRRQLRRAMLASTVGTLIEWYDFLLYGTVSALVFGKLFFPHSSPIDRRAGGVQRLFHRVCRAADRGGDLRPLRRPDRAQGDLDRDLAGDRHRDRCRGPRPDLCQHRHLGRRAADDHSPDPGDRGRRRMGRLGAAGDGMGANHQESRLHLRPGRNSARRPGSSWPIWRCCSSAGFPATSS